jgi:hypothetical protein
MCYLEGRGVERDDARAARWLERAALRNYRAEQAQIMMGHLFREGRSVEQNTVEACRWYRKPCEGIVQLYDEKSIGKRFDDLERAAGAEAWTAAYACPRITNLNITNHNPLEYIREYDKPDNLNP